jgi:hypothetical protein
VPVLALFGVVLLVVLGADGCGDRETGTALENLLGSLDSQQWGEIELGEYPFLRVHVYPESIDKDQWVGPFLPGAEGDENNRIVCMSDDGCLVFFVDTNHWAHFAHKTVVALYRLDEGVFQPPMVGSWWPLLDGTPIFDTVRKREDWFNRDNPDDMQTIVYPRDLPRDLVPSFMATDEMGFALIEPSSTPPTSPPSPPPTPPATVEEDCDVWAVIVNGFDDLDDTFHIDTGDMYRALRGHGVPEGQIHYLCPEPAVSEGCEIVASKAKLQQVLEVDMGTNIPATDSLADSSCQEMLFFVSTHGDSTLMWCGGDQPQYSDLKTWLDQVRCAKITIVVEGCSSGSLVSLLGPAPTGQTRSIFTSTDQGGVSYRDVDKVNDLLDSNPGDIGSETVWGYVEAIASGIADADNDTDISFTEATDYAILKDITAQGLNQPQVSPGGTVSPAEHSCAAITAANKMKVELTQTAVVPPAGPGQALRCRCNNLSAEVTFPATNPPAFASATFYWTKEPWTGSSVPTWDLNNQVHFKQIKNSTRLLPVSSIPYSLIVEWEVGSNIDAGTSITLLAVADSPDAPIPDGPIGLDALIANDWASAIKLEVVNPSSCFLFPCGCRTVRCN